MIPIMTLNCDFCYAENPTRRYPCRDFEVQTVADFPIQQASQGDWAACDECAGLIDKDRWGLLVTRCLRKFIKQNPDVQMPSGQMRRYFESLFREFRANRIETV